MSKLVTRVLVSFVIVLVLGTVNAHAQVSVGGSSGLGIFSAGWSWFQSNAMLGIIGLGVLGLGISMMMLRCHIALIAQVCGGAAIVAAAVTIATSFMSLS